MKTVFILSFLVIFQTSCKKSISNSTEESTSSVLICTQTWTTKNLDVTNYRNGDLIPEIQDPTAWCNLTTGAWCHYNNDPANDIIYGKLYNFFAVNDPRGLAPQGWHIPSLSEWNILRNCLGGEVVAGGKMKETGTIYWNSPNTGASNITGFTARPSGCRNSYYGGTFNLPGGAFVFSGEDCWWWSTDAINGGSTSMKKLWYDTGSMYSDDFIWTMGASIRLIKN